jgi:hypothetical protein
MEEIKAYQCDHCGKVNKTKAYIKRHEKKCHRNVETKSCITCQNSGYKYSPKMCLIGKSETLTTNCPFHNLNDQL